MQNVEIITFLLAICIPIFRKYISVNNFIINSLKCTKLAIYYIMARYNIPIFRKYIPVNSFIINGF